MKPLYADRIERFVLLARAGGIVPHLSQEYAARYKSRPGALEAASWSTSLRALADTLDTLPQKDGYILLEYQMPTSSYRCDALLVGRDKAGISHAVVIELKQWQHVAASAIRDSVAMGNRNYTHPSAQARGYCDYLQFCHDAFTEHNVQISGCSFLHDMTDSKSLNLLRDKSIYSSLPDRFPVFGANDGPELLEFLQDKVSTGGAPVADLVQNGGYRPSTKLLDVLVKVIEGNFEWRLLDEQILAFNTVISRVEDSTKANRKHVVVVRGGPGTGKSALSLQLVAYAARRRWRAVFATGSKAFITVLQAKTKQLADAYLKRMFNAKYKNAIPVESLFTTFARVAELGSEQENALDLVVGDEAHRLWDYRRQKFSNFNKQLSDVPMIRELVRAARVTVLFLDDNQSVRADEIGTAEYLIEHVRALGIGLDIVDLNAQFRCAGSEGYVRWIDHLLGFGGDPSTEWATFDEYDFRVASSPIELQAALDALKAGGARCRMVAGFCWKWSDIQGNGALVPDITDSRFGAWKGAWIEKGDRYAEPSDSRYFKWATDDSYYDQVGSIYSVQGFEFDYIGVIFGEDLIRRGGEWQSDLTKNKDSVFRRELRASAADPTERLRNIYRVLLTRGMRGALVYIVDPTTRAYIEEQLKPASEQYAGRGATLAND